MDYKIKYTKQAILELNIVYKWYRSKEPDLGERFKNAFGKIKISLKENPKLFKEVGTNHRRAVLGSSFPYTIHYLTDDKTKTIKIIGVFHQSKNIELVKEQVKIRKVHEQKQDKNKNLNRRLSQMKQIRQRKDQERDKGRERGRGLER